MSTRDKLRMMREVEERNTARIAGHESKEESE